MRKFEILYFNDKKYAVPEETDNYSIFEVNEDKAKMRCFYQEFNGETIICSNEIWVNYTYNGFEHDITEEEVFALCL